MVPNRAVGCSHSRVTLSPIRVPLPVLSRSFDVPCAHAGRRLATGNWKGAPRVVALTDMPGIPDTDACKVLSNVGEQASLRLHKPTSAPPHTQPTMPSERSKQVWEGLLKAHAHPWRALLKQTLNATVPIGLQNAACAMALERFRAATRGVKAFTRSEISMLTEWYGPAIVREVLHTLTKAGPRFGRAAACEGVAAGTFSMDMTTTATMVPSSPTSAHSEAAHVSVIMPAIIKPAMVCPAAEDNSSTNPPQGSDWRKGWPFSVLLLELLARVWRVGSPLVTWRDPLFCEFVVALAAILTSECDGRGSHGWKSDSTTEVDMACDTRQKEAAVVVKAVCRTLTCVFHSIVVDASVQGGADLGSLAGQLAVMDLHQPGSSTTKVARVESRGTETLPAETVRVLETAVAALVRVSLEWDQVEVPLATMAVDDTVLKQALAALGVAGKWGHPVMIAAMHTAGALDGAIRWACRSATAGHLHAQLPTDQPTACVFALIGALAPQDPWMATHVTAAPEVFGKLARGLVACLGSSHPHVFGVATAAASSLCGSNAILRETWCAALGEAGVVDVLLHHLSATVGKTRDTVLMAVDTLRAVLKGCVANQESLARAPMDQLAQFIGFLRHPDTSVVKAVCHLLGSDCTRRCPVLVETLLTHGILVDLVGVAGNCAGSAELQAAAANAVYGLAVGTTAHPFGAAYLRAIPTSVPAFVRALESIVAWQDQQRECDTGNDPTAAGSKRTMDIAFTSCVHILRAISATPGGTRAFADERLALKAVLTREIANGDVIPRGFEAQVLLDSLNLSPPPVGKKRKACGDVC